MVKIRLGIIIGNDMRKIVGYKLKKMLLQKYFAIILIFLKILHLISISNDTDLLATEGYCKPLSFYNSDRLANIYKYKYEFFYTSISLNDVVSLSKSIPQLFCRSFKKRNNKKFVDYLNTIRTVRSCKYLRETDLSISQINYACGYKSISYFYKLFNDLKKLMCKSFKASIC